MAVAGECPSDICPAQDGFLFSPPSLPGNAFMLAAFAALIPLNLYTGIRYKTPLFTTLIISGLLLEVISHIGKVLLHSNVANTTYFSLYMVANLWGPTLIGSAIYTVLPHVMAIYGPEFRILSHPIYLNILFVILDIFTLAFQSVGMVFASKGTTKVEMSQGVSIGVAGLSMQMASMVIFIVLYYYVNYRISHRRHILDSKLAVVFLSSKFKIFLLGTQAATFILILRLSIRIAALSTGLSGSLFQSEPVSYVLDDSAVLLACIILSLAPPGRAFGPSWQDTTPFTLRRYCRSGIRLPLREQSRPSVRARGISQPYPTTTNIFVPHSPRLYDPAGQPPAPKLVSPKVNPVYTRPAYDLSPAAVVPFIAPETLNSPYLGITSPIKKKKMWGGTTPDATQLVNPNGIWS